MEKYFDIIASSPLFSSIDRAELSSMLMCLGSRRISYSKNDTIFFEGSPAKTMGMVLTGSVNIERTDFYGTRSLIASVSQGELFAEMFVCADVDALPVSVVAAADCTVLLMDAKRLMTTCSNACIFHNTLIENLLHTVARKNLILNMKIHCMSQRTTREKIMTYLSEIATQSSSSEFTIPFDRQGLADYLGVERSAMSAEISRMKKDGLIDTQGSFFRLL